MILSPVVQTFQQTNAISLVHTHISILPCQYITQIMWLILVYALDVQPWALQCAGGIIYTNSRKTERWKWTLRCFEARLSWSTWHSGSGSHFLCDRRWGKVFPWCPLIYRAFHWLGDIVCWDKDVLMARDCVSVKEIQCKPFILICLGVNRYEDCRVWGREDEPVNATPACPHLTAPHDCDVAPP